MAKKRTTKQIEEPEVIEVRSTKYKSAVCGLGNAVTTANDWDAEGYDVAYCFAVVATADDKPVQAVYMLAKKRDA